MVMDIFKIRNIPSLLFILSVLSIIFFYSQLSKPVVIKRKISGVDEPINNQRKRPNASDKFYDHEDHFGHISTFPKDDMEFIFVEKEEDGRFAKRNNLCNIPKWNQVHTDAIPDAEVHAEWMRLNISRKRYLYHKSPSPFAAFAYDTHIAVTLTSENQFGNKMFCRYYDCHMNEIKTPFESVVFPESTVFCGRRVGAEYISITRDADNEPEPPIQIQNRVENVPQHFFTVCLATLYGPEPKFLQIVDFIEYYKLQGATKIHVYIRNVTDYDRRLLEDYVRTGEIEVIKVQDNWWRDDFMWHMAQINDCHFRSRHYSKWTTFIDIDERIEMKKDSQTIAEYLETIDDPNINNLQFVVQWVQKTEPSPPEYTSDNQLLDNLVFRKYHNTSSTGSHFVQPKCIIRPERVGAMTIHAPLAVYKGFIQTFVDSKVGVVRHYRNLYGGLLHQGIKIANRHGPYKNTSLPLWIERDLTAAILKRINYVYNINDGFTCEEKHHIYYLHGQMAECYRVWRDEKRRREKMSKFDSLMSQGLLAWKTNHGNETETRSSSNSTNELITELKLKN